MTTFHHMDDRGGAAPYFAFTGPEWRAVADLDGLRRMLAMADSRVTLDASVTARERDLPMYDAVKLVCLTSPKWRAGVRICYLVLAGELFRLDGSSSPIHDVNAKAPITLNDQNILFYMSFFCFFVRGDEGPFYIVHDMADGMLPPGFVEGAGEKKPADVFREPKVDDRTEDGAWRVSGLVLYSNALFLADFKIDPSGMMEMVDDTPLIQDLPGGVWAPLTPPSQTFH